MKLLFDNLELLLRLAALAQLGVVLLNLFLVRLMNWRPDLEAMSLLIREVFQIHIYFISITLAIFGVLTGASQRISQLPLIRSAFGWR